MERGAYLPGRGHPDLAGIYQPGNMTIDAETGERMPEEKEQKRVSGREGIEMDKRKRRNGNGWAEEKETLRTVVVLFQSEHAAERRHPFVHDALRVCREVVHAVVALVLGAQREQVRVERRVERRQHLLAVSQVDAGEALRDRLIAVVVQRRPRAGQAVGRGRLVQDEESPAPFLWGTKAVRQCENEVRLSGIIRV